MCIFGKTKERKEPKKIYQVIFKDEYDNMECLGFYKKLKYAVKDVNKRLEIYGVQLKKDDLREHASTFGSAFDTSMCDVFPENEDVAGVSVRGFIFNGDILLKAIRNKIA